MKSYFRNYSAFFVLAASLVVAGCSSAPADGNSNATNNNNGGANGNKVVANNSGFETSDGNSHPMTDTGEVKKITDSNTASLTDYKGQNVPPPTETDTGRPTQIEEKMSKIQKLREMAKNQSGPKPTPMQFDAPENSYITQELTDVAKETRVFRNHPQLAKVERVHTPKGISMKVFLKNGKVVNVDGKEFGALRDASSAKILQLAGVTQ